MTTGDRIRDLWIADFVLAQLRAGIGSAYERYTKYTMVGAWAGSCLVTPDGTVEVYFDSKPPVAQSDGWGYYFAAGGVRVGVFGEPGLVSRTVRHVPSALERAVELSKAARPGTVMIASIHASLLIDVPSKEQDRGALFQDVCRGMGSRLGLRWVASPGESSGFGDNRAEGDVTFLLSRPTPEDELVQLVRRIFPDIQQPLVGWGALPIATADDRISWCHLYLRQVYEPAEPVDRT